MKLSPKLIIRTIEQHMANPLNSSHVSTALTLKRPIFLTDQNEWPEHTICIAEEIPSTLLTKKIPADTLLLVRHCDKQIQTDQSANCFLLNDACSLPALFNMIQELFDLYDEWDETLQGLLNSEDTIQNLLDSSYMIFKNPLVLREADFFILSYSGIIDENPDLSHIIDPVNSYDTLTTCKTDQTYLESLELRQPYFLPEYLSGNRELCFNLFDHGIYSHRLILVEEFEEIREEEGPLLQHLAFYVHALLRRTEENSISESYPLEDILKDIIARKQTDYTAINTALAESGWFSGHRYCCMMIKMSSMNGQNMTSNYLCRHFEEIIPGSCAFRYEESIIVFINLSRYDHSIDGLLNNTVVFLRDSFLKTGISNPITGVLDLRYCYIQAKIALEYGSKYQPFRWVHKFDDITIQYFMECCLQELPVHMVCSSKLLTLKEHDRLHHSDYYHTLKIYLESHLNAVQASRKLFIHRSTFLYRLEKIQELVAINFEDQALLFYLTISYNILELNIPDSSFPQQFQSKGDHK